MFCVYFLQVEFSNPVAQKKTVFDYQLGAVGSVEQAFPHRKTTGDSSEKNLRHFLSCFLFFLVWYISV